MTGDEVILISLCNNVNDLAVSIADCNGRGGEAKGNDCLYTSDYDIYTVNLRAHCD